MAEDMTPEQLAAQERREAIARLKARDEGIDASRPPAHTHPLPRVLRALGIGATLLVLVLAGYGWLISRGSGGYPPGIKSPTARASYREGYSCGRLWVGLGNRGGKAGVAKATAYCDDLNSGSGSGGLGGPPLIQSIENRGVADAVRSASK